MENQFVRGFLIKAVAIVGSGGLIFGYDIGVISGTLPSIKDDFNLNGFEEGLVVSILYAGSIVGSLFGGPLCDAIGRWKTIQIQNLIFIIGAVLTGLAPNLGVLCVGRFFVGIASAVSGLADVPYLTEIAPTDYRGILSGQYEILVGAGILLSFCLDLAFASFDNGWRIAFILPGVFAFIQSLCLFLLPESPKWLVAKGEIEQASVILQQIYGEQLSETDMKNLLCTMIDNPVKSDVDDIRDVSMVITSALHPLPEGPNDVSNDKEVSSIHSRQSSITESRKNSIVLAESTILQEYYYPIVVILMIQILSQITGANVIRNYAPTIFEDGGVSTGLALFYNVLLGIVKLLFTIISVYYIESTGRRKFFLFGIGWVMAGMFFLMIASIVSPSGNLHDPAIFVVGCALVYAGFGFGYGPMPWVLSSEMVPTAIRGRVLCLSLIASNLTQLIMNFLFIPMTEYLLQVGTYTIFFSLNLLTYYYLYHFLVETREIPPDQILKQLVEKYHATRKMTWTEWLGLCLTQESSYTALCID